MSAEIVALHVSTASRAPNERRERVQLLTEAGVEGDRHARPGSRRQVLMVEAEVLEALGLAPGVIREQVTVRGLDLNALVFGTRLRCGSAVLEIAGPCAPCEYMNEIRPGLEQSLLGRRGRFARVVEPGTIAVGDAIRAEGGAAV